MQSAFARSHWGSAPPPLPSLAHKLGTEELCQTRAGSRSNHVGVRAADRADRQSVLDRRAVGEITYKGFVARTFDQIGDPVHRPAERAFFPPLGVRRAI